MQVPKGKAYACSRTRKGGWAIAQSPILTTTITLERLGKRGCACMNDYYEKVSPMFNEPLYPRTVLPVPIKSGYSGVRASPCHVLHGGAGYSIVGCLLSTVSANHCQHYVSLSLACCVVRLSIFYFQKGRRFFLIQFYLRWTGTLFAKFWLVCRLVRLGNVCDCCAGYSF